MRDDQDKNCSINHKKGVCAAEFFRHQAECGGQSTMQLPSAQNSVQQQQKHLGPSRQYWRDIILGVNDGLVSTFLLVTGVAGGGMRNRDILLTAIAGALAGAVSMAAGEYIATKSQNEVMKGEINLEKEHVKNNLDDEMAELNDLFPKIGITSDNSMHTGMRRTMKEFYRQNPDALLKIMAALEFGVLEYDGRDVDEEEGHRSLLNAGTIRSPVRAGLFSCILFILGSLPSVIPFIFSGDTPVAGLIAAAIATTTSLLLVGAIKTWATRGGCLVAAVENLVITGAGGGFAYGVGVVFERILR